MWSYHRLSPTESPHSPRNCGLPRVHRREQFRHPLGNPPHTHTDAQQDSEIDHDPRYKVPQADRTVTLRDRKKEVELGFDRLTGYEEAQRCLNCDVQTVFDAPKCIECDACVDICPVDCITFTENGEEAELRTRLKAPAINPQQDLYVADGLKTDRVMVKDEDVCLHCGMCAERCPTGAWDMQKFLLETAKPKAKQPACAL